MTSAVRRITICATALVLAASATACPPSPTDIHTAEMMFDLSEALNGLREDNAILQDQIDSLRMAVARQDTAILRISRFAGVATPTP